MWAHNNVTWKLGTNYKQGNELWTLACIGYCGLHIEIDSVIVFKGQIWPMRPKILLIWPMRERERERCIAIYPRWKHIENKLNYVQLENCILV